MTSGSPRGFRRASERRVYKGRVIELVITEVVTPDGQVIERDIVHHPGAVAVVPIIGDEAILVRQYRAALDTDFLEIPAGLRDVPEEPPEATAARELAEEIGMHPGHLEMLCRVRNTPGFCDELVTIYLATDLEPVQRQAHGVEEEHMAIERVRLDDVDALIASGELTDGKSIIGLQLVLRKLGR
jgi:ADP-ribose pyrophosphatase